MLPLFPATTTPVTEEQLYQLLVVFIPTVPALCALIVGLFNHKSVHELKKGVNGRLTQLLESAEAAAFERGRQSVLKPRAKHERRHPR